MCFSGMNKHPEFKENMFLLVDLNDSSWNIYNYLLDFRKFNVCSTCLLISRSTFMHCLSYVGNPQLMIGLLSDRKHWMNC